MSLLREKRSWSSFFYSRVTLVVMLGLCVLLAMSVYERYTIERQMAERRMESEAELEALTMRKDELKEKVEYLSGDAGIEAEIRGNFDVAKEGERVVVIVDQEKKNVEEYSGTSTEDEVEEGGFWSWLFPW